MATIVEGLSSLVAHLPPRELERVLSFARWRIRRPSCISHRQREVLLRLRVDPEVGEAIEQTLVDCERT
jgi:hypothetical protein